MQLLERALRFIDAIGSVPNTESHMLEHSLPLWKHCKFWNLLIIGDVLLELAGAFEHVLDLLGLIELPFVQRLVELVGVLEHPIGRRRAGAHGRRRLHQALVFGWVRV